MAFEKQQRRSIDFWNCSLSSSLKLYMVNFLLNDENCIEIISQNMHKSCLFCLDNSAVRPRFKVHQHLLGKKFPVKT